MDLKEIRETPIWELYEKGRNYHRRTGIYVDTDRNYRFFNGNQWEGAKLGDVEPIQINFIYPIVKYKLAVIHDNLYAVHYSSQNYENRQFQKEAKRYCDLLNGYARRMWEKEKMDVKGRDITIDAAVNDEGIIYVNFDKEKMSPVHEIVKKNDIYYGNENDDDIQAQPYILIRKRMPVVNAIEFALNEGMSDDKVSMIIGDNDTFEESGDAAKDELDDMVTVVYKMYKEDGTVRYSVATRWVEIANDVDLGISRYPVAHFLWEGKEGSARGEGVVRNLIPNQIEVNRIEVRRAVTAKYQAHPRTVVDVTKIQNPQALKTVGGIIQTNGQPVDDVHKIIGVIQPAQMSSDVKLLRDDLISTSRELAGASEAATGEVNPEDASGRAILAVQQAHAAPMTEQKERYKNFVEDLAHIDLEYLIAYSEDGVNMEEEVIDPMTGEEYVQMVNVPQSVLQQLRAYVKIDVTPKGAFDIYAMEKTMENYLQNGFFHPQKITELEPYIKSLPDGCVTPKQEMLEVIEGVKKTQAKIAQMQARAQLRQQRAMQFLNADPESQAAQVSQAKMLLQQQQMAQQAQQQQMPM